MNLKKYLDALNGARARVQQIAAQIDELFDAGKTDEALAKQGELDDATGKAEAAEKLYYSMLNVNGGAVNAQQLTPVGGNVQVITDEADQPFGSDGEFFMAVKVAARHPSLEDARLRSKKVKNATGMSEGVPAEGGYLVPPKTADPILEKMYSTGDILSRIVIDPVTGNSMTYNAVDEASRATGSRHGGVTGYWVSEGGTIPASKAKWRQIELKLKKVAALCYGTDEQLEDTSNLESWLSRVAPEELIFMSEDAIINGDGVGKPLGILNSPALLTILRTDASEIDATDVANMWAHRYAGVKDYVWFGDQSIFPQLFTMTVGQYPVFIPAGSAANSPYATLLGRPYIETEYNQALGTAGDLLLASMSQYQAINKGGVKKATSLEVAFVTDEAAFRFTHRIDGEPTWDAPLTTKSGTSVSPFVVLGAST